MKRYHKSLSRREELKAIAMLMLRRMEINLVPIDRMIFLRLLICHGGRKISTEDLKALAEEVKVHWLTLKKSLKVLLEKGLCEQADEKSLKLNKGFLPRQVGYRCKWTPSDQLIVALEKAKEGDRSTAELKENKSAKKSHKVIGGKKTASELAARYPRYDFLEILFRLMFDVKISHKQKNADQLLELNYKQWLVLVNMILSSDSNGIVFKVGTYELSNWTGMSRNAIQRAINELFSMGILRSKIDGTLNSNLLQSVASVYCINLSASIWGEKRIFGHYYFLKFPKEYTPIAYQAFSFIKNQISSASLNQNSIDENTVLIEFENNFTRSQGATLSCKIEEEYDFVSNYIKDFSRYILPIMPSSRLDKSPLNTEKKNFDRIVFLLNYFIQSKIFNLRSIEAFVYTPMQISSIEWFKNYLTGITLSQDQFCRSSGDDNVHQSLFQVIQVIEQSRASILFYICQAMLRNEVTPVINKKISLSNTKAYFNIAILPSQNSELCDRVYFCRYKAEEIKQKTEQDTFHILEFKKISDYSEKYRLESRQFENELTLEEQKEYGLFNLKKNNKS